MRTPRQPFSPSCWMTISTFARFRSKGSFIGFLSSAVYASISYTVKLSRSVSVNAEKILMTGVSWIAARDRPVLCVEPRLFLAPLGEQQALHNKVAAACMARHAACCIAPRESDMHAFRSWQGRMRLEKRTKLLNISCVSPQECLSGMLAGKEDLARNGAHRLSTSQNICRSTFR